MINEFVASAMYRNTSRRELMRRAGLLGISASVIPFVLRSHGVLAQDATPAAGGGAVGSTIVVPAGLRTDLTGQSINAVLAAAASPDIPFLEAAHAKFAEATGIT